MMHTAKNYNFRPCSSQTYRATTWNHLVHPKTACHPITVDSWAALLMAESTSSNHGIRIALARQCRTHRTYKATIFRVKPNRGSLLGTKNLVRQSITSDKRARTLPVTQSRKTLKIPAFSHRGFSRSLRIRTALLSREKPCPPGKSRTNC